MVQPVVKIVEGQLSGLIQKNLDGEEFYSFLGVPYAEPPIGELRFKNALPIKPWKGVKVATEEGPVSLQAGCLPDEIKGSEDCLTLNVFTKKLSEDGSMLPVMVWIHSGGFKVGSKNTVEHGPEHLMLEDVVLVCINYRLGILGFLNIVDTSLGIPSNVGLKDQIEALRWVQRNIKYFGGNSKNVTLFGNSAGGSSVELLLHSPLADGLFHRAIMQSGSMLNPWVFGNCRVLDFMKFIGKSCSTEKEAVDILMTMPGQELCRHQINFCKLSGKPFGLEFLGIVVEPPHDKALITKPAIELIKSTDCNKVPIMLGFAVDEGLIFKCCNLFETVVKKSTSQEDLFKMFLPSYINESKLKEDVCTKLINHYFKDENEYNTYKFAGDIYFIMGILASAKHYVKKKDNPVYLYKLSLDAGLNACKIASKIEIPGTCHGDELGYLFKQDVSNLIMGDLEQTVVRNMVKLWTNFAKYGNPTPYKEELNLEWAPSNNDLSYLDIGEKFVMESGIQEPIDLWKDIYVTLFQD
ncbi:esterase FE4-like [Diabrotica undecimpunctata]|uniref:esterase FE4-like n=1 Tax=Diabrotica undecimpunctata TaxID=50387 RepID=UPI003B6406AD